MTNEQNAIQIEGYLSELNAAIDGASKMIKPTMVRPQGMIAIATNGEDLETYPELETMFDLASRMQKDIDNLRGLGPSFGG